MPQYERRVAILGRRRGAPEETVLASKSNLATTYSMLGRLDEALLLREEVYAGRVKLDGYRGEDTLIATSNYAVALLDLERYAEAKSILRKAIPNARRTLGAEHDLTLNFRRIYAECLCRDGSRDDIAEAVAIYEDVLQRTRRIFGDDHPSWRRLPELLGAAREFLASSDT